MPGTPAQKRAAESGSLVYSGRIALNRPDRRLVGAVRGHLESLHMITRCAVVVASQSQECAKGNGKSDYE